MNGRHSTQHGWRRSRSKCKRRRNNHFLFSLASAKLRSPRRSAAKGHHSLTRSRRKRRSTELSLLSALTPWRGNGMKWPFSLLTSSTYFYLGHVKHGAIVFFLLLAWFVCKNCVSGARKKEVTFSERRMFRSHRKEEEDFKENENERSQGWRQFEEMTSSSPPRKIGNERQRKSVIVF